MFVQEKHSKSRYYALRPCPTGQRANNPKIWYQLRTQSRVDASTKGLSYTQGLIAACDSGRTAGRRRRM